MKKIAAIDIGTNSVLYSLFEVKGKADIRELHFQRHSPRIGGRLAGRRKPTITGENYAVLKTILVRDVDHAMKAGADDILIAATNPLRLAKNGRQVRKRLQLDIGHQVSILSSDREAHLSFLGAVGRLDRAETAVVIDMGGGSTEFVVYRGHRRQAFVSIPEGAVSLTEKFDSQTKARREDFPEFEKMLCRYRKRADIIRPYLDAPIYLVGGTSTALAYLKDEHIHQKRRGVLLTRREISRYVEVLADLSLTCRRQLLAIDKKRAEIIFAGAFWYNYLFKVLNITKARATPWGLRHGMAIDFLDREADSA
jgi:exopolyphosphatase/guanosine-5'-triphosphate,3'-diphosphate pyrophosphatase